MDKIKKITATLISLILIVTALYPEPGYATTCGTGSSITFTDIGGGQCRGYLTTTGTNTFTLPTDWSSSANSIQTIGGGGGGNNGAGESNGGGGGAFASSTNITLTGGATITYAVGAGGTNNANPGGDGGDTWFNSATM